jgi:DNA-binding NarL/FixJ family response regulator
MANLLKLSVKTIEKHRANLMRKLKLHNIAEVTRFAMTSGIINNNTDNAAELRRHRSAY